MKRLLSFLAVFLFVSTLLFAEGIRERTTTPAEPVSGSSVWKITKDGNIMFLGGSIHILRENDFPLPREFDYALSESDVLVLEANIEQMQEPEIAFYFLAQMFLPGDLLLQDMLDPEIYELLVSVCIDFGLSIDDFVKFKPAIVVTMLTMMSIHEYGFVQEGVDHYFLEKAKDNNIPTVFLESVQSQINLITTMGEGYENEFVLYSILDMENTDESLELLLTDWKTGSAIVSDASLISMKEDWPQIYKSMITDRHDAWLPQIEEFFASGQVHFIIAGLFHMHGPDGLLRTLEDLGYSVEQVIIE